MAPTWPGARRARSSHVSGLVRGVAGKPIAGATLDIWQAKADGIYDLQTGRYFVTALQNEDKFVDFKIKFKDEYFAPGDLDRRSGR